MTNAQKLEVRASEIRQRLNEISGLEGDKLTDEIRTESDTLQNEYRDTETKRRAAIVAEGDEAAKAVTEPTESSETRERRELRGKARVSDFVSSVLSGRPLAGASSEYADAVGMPGLLPMELLDGPEPEERAVTPGPTAETVTTTRPTVPFAFARTDAAALGIAMPMVAPGEAHFPALTTAPPAGAKAKDAAAAVTAAAFTLTKREPKRITGQFLIRLEDLSLMPSMETDLRRGIASATADALDVEVVNALFVEATAVAVAAAKETFATAISRFAGVVDGKHANGFGDIRALIGVSTFALYASIFANADKGDISAFDHLTAKLGALRVSTRAPVVASSGQKGLAVLAAQGQGIQVPLWRGLELIVDPYTFAGKGQRVVTAVLQYGTPFVPYGVAQVIEVHPKIS